MLLIHIIQHLLYQEKRRNEKKYLKVAKTLNSKKTDLWRKKLITIRKSVLANTIVATFMFNLFFLVIKGYQLDTNTILRFPINFLRHTSEKKDTYII